MNQNILKKIAIVDVDGTLIDGQIQQKLIVFLWKNGYISPWYFFRINLWFISYKLGLVRNIDSILEYGLEYLKNQPTQCIDLLIETFIEKDVSFSVFPKSFELLERLRRNGYTLVILSSAVDAVISHVAKLFKVDDFICTKLEQKGGVYTGKICGKIVYGDEKVNELRMYFIRHNYSLINAEAYADHESDISLLKAVGKAFVVNPGGRMRRVALREGIGIVNTR